MSTSHDAPGHTASDELHRLRDAAYGTKQAPSAMVKALRDAEPSWMRLLEIRPSTIAPLSIPRADEDA